MTSGRLLTHPARARHRFLELALQPEPLIDLTEVSLVIALEEYPALHVDRYLRQLDSWSAAIRERLEGCADVSRAIDEINRLLFEQEGFHGEADDYYNPHTAFMNEVLDRHAGLPITLSILYLELSRRVGVSTAGVALPGHFLVKVSLADSDLLIDPFDGGRVLTTLECQKLLDEVYGGGVLLREHHLRSESKRKILARLLCHLKSVYLMHDNPEGALASVDRLLILDQNDPYEIRDRAMLAMQTHRYTEALESLQNYLALRPQAEDRSAILEHVEFLRSWLQQN
jgi:regulator of sirC expression with transglutaminase-like and TPR domain